MIPWTRTRGSSLYGWVRVTDEYRTDPGAMATWLRSDLASTSQNWTIAFWHHPPYSKGSHDSDTEYELVGMREVFLPILEANGVDLVLTGHSHDYERTWLINGQGSIGWGQPPS